MSDKPFIGECAGCGQTLYREIGCICKPAMSEAQALRQQLADVTAERDEARAVLAKLAIAAEAREKGYAKRENGDTLNWRAANALVEQLPRVQQLLSGSRCKEYGHAGPKCGAYDCWLRNE